MLDEGQEVRKAGRVPYRIIKAAWTFSFPENVFVLLWRGAATITAPFYKRGTRQIMSKPPTAQRRRRRCSTSPDGQAFPQRLNAEKIAKAHLYFTHLRLTACFFFPKVQKKDHTKVNVPTQTASESPSARQMPLSRPDLQNEPGTESSALEE